MKLPDFIIIGAMKAGTTTLWRRLEALDGVSFPDMKEPTFFALEDRWARGLDWYASLFEGLEGRVGEASATYADAAVAEISATRMRKVIPEVRLVFAVRDPVARMRSHYRHEVLRSRERRPFVEAAGDVEAQYVTKSLYGSALSAYLKVFDRDQMLVFQMEDLDAEVGVWEAILSHIGVEQQPMSRERFNESSRKRQFTPLYLWMWERGLGRASGSLPGPMRKLAKAVMTRDPEQGTELLASAEQAPSSEVVDLIGRDQELFRSLTL